MIIVIIIITIGRAVTEVRFAGARKAFLFGLSSNRIRYGRLVVKQLHYFAGKTIISYHGMFRQVVATNGINYFPREIFIIGSL